MSYVTFINEIDSLSSWSRFRVLHTILVPEVAPKGYNAYVPFKVLSRLVFATVARSPVR